VNNKTRLELLKQAKSSGYTGSYIDLFKSHTSSADNHTEANSKKEIQKGLEGAPYGSSAKLNFDTLEAHSLEGRQDHPVKVTADGNYQGILFPGEEKFIVDTSSEVEETPMLTYGGVPIKREEIKSQLDTLIPSMVEGRSMKEYHAGGLYHNINHKKKSGTSNSKKDSTISTKAYSNMQEGFPKKQGDTESGVVDPDYKFTRGSYNVSDTDISDVDFDLLYNAVESHEHRGSIDEEGYNSFIRTKAKKSGSSAYGPVQLTGNLLKNITTPGIRRFYDVENMDTEYHKQLVDQSKLFLKYGGGDYVKYYNKETGQYDGLDKEDILNTYEYGGEGFLGDSDEDREKYKILGIEMLKGGYRKEIEEHKASDKTHLYNMIKDYGTGTDAYAKAVEKKYNELIKERDDKATKLNEQQKLILDRAIKNVETKLDSVKNNK
tara:strand:+ start:9540 stop:10841 length:1302 start_codon:yes stop_codon:yes gene_type:complete